MSKNYYKILGVNKNASPEEIKKSYRKLAMRYHPDKNQGNHQAESTFKDINEAYEVLKDEKKRANYDNYGSSNFQSADGFTASNDFSGFSDIFGDIFSDFGSTGSSQNASRENVVCGADLRYDISITLEQAYLGIKKDISFITYVVCSMCDATGSKNPSDIKKCNVCFGSGTTKVQQGFFVVQKTCYKCDGQGIQLNNPCSTCFGTGRIKKRKNLAVMIPAGSIDNSKIKLFQQGEAGIRSGKCGDLYIYVLVQKHEFYTREGRDLYCKVPIKMTTAILGGVVTIPTLDAKIIRVTIPAGTQPSSRIRLRGKGMTIIKSVRYGDLYVDCHVELPSKLSDKQRILLREFDALQENGSSPKAESFFNKIKTFVTDLG